MSSVTLQIVSRIFCNSFSNRKASCLIITVHKYKINNWKYLFTVIWVEVIYIEKILIWDNWIYRSCVIGKITSKYEVSYSQQWLTGFDWRTWSWISRCSLSLLKSAFKIKVNVTVFVMVDWVFTSERQTLLACISHLLITANAASRSEP